MLEGFPLTATDVALVFLEFLRLMTIIKLNDSGLIWEDVLLMDEVLPEACIADTCFEVFLLTFVYWSDMTLCSLHNLVVTHLISNRLPSMP